MISIEHFFLLFASALTLVSLTTPVMRKIAIKLRFIDEPNLSHKSHLEPVPYLGGVAIIVGILSVVYVAIFTQELIRGNLWIANSLFGPALFLGIIGLIDDRKGLDPLPRFLAQSVAGIFTAMTVIATNTVGNPSGNSLLDAVITTLWIVGISNSINFFDNLDGGAAGAVAVVALGLFAIALSSNQGLIAASSVTIFGSTLGFLIWNKSPARIYMGDAGALFLGFVLAALIIRLNPDVEGKFISFAIPILLLAIPILDTSVAVFSRIRRKKSIFQGGQDHLSHRLIRNGLSKRQTAYVLWLLAALFVSLAVVVAIVEVYVILLIWVSGIIWLTLFLCFMRTSDE